MRTWRNRKERREKERVEVGECKGGLKHKYESSDVCEEGTGRRSRCENVKGWK